MNTIPLLIPSLPSADALMPYLRRIDAQRQYTNFGPLSNELERRLAAIAPSQGAPFHATTVSSATVGLELALQASRLAPGARVLIPAITFVATATAVRRAGMVPVIADVDPQTWCLTPALTEAACRSTRIDAVIPVATFGCPQDPADWDAFARERGIPVIVDAAGAFGNQQPGATTDVVYSFHATKALGAGEGGAVLSSNLTRIAQIRRLANFGIDTACGELADWGTNGKMSEYHCAVALASFDAWDDARNARSALHSRYLERLRTRCPDLSFQYKPRDGVYSLMTVLLPASMRARELAARLDLEGIGTRRWYCPALHQHPALSATPRVGNLAVAEDLGERMLGLPFFVGLSEAQIERIVESLARALAVRGAQS